MQIFNVQPVAGRGFSSTCNAPRALRAPTTPAARPNRRRPTYVLNVIWGCRAATHAIARATKCHALFGQRLCPLKMHQKTARMPAACHQPERYVHRLCCDAQHGKLLLHRCPPLSMAPPEASVRSLIKADLATSCMGEGNGGGEGQHARLNSRALPRAPTRAPGALSPCFQGTRQIVSRDHRWHDAQVARHGRRHHIIMMMHRAG